MLGEEAVEAADHPLLPLDAGEHLPRFAPHGPKILIRERNLVPAPTLPIRSVGVEDRLLKGHDFTYLFQGKPELVKVLNILYQVKGEVGVELAPPLREGPRLQKAELGVVLQDAP